MKKSSYISFIIPNWNHRQLLYECISSIYNTSNGANHEIIVVDNGSTDDSVEYIKKSFPQVRLIQNEVNLGYAKAINQGAALAKGDLLFLLNNDVKLLENTADKLASYLIKNPEVGATAPLLYYPNGKLQISCRRFPTPEAILLEKLKVKQIGPYKKLKLTSPDHLAGGEVQQPMSSVLMVKRKCWEAVGPMDERFPVFFNDVDWCYRLYKNTNYKICLYPEARAIHHAGASIKRLGYSKRRFEAYRGLLRFYLKHLKINLL